MFVYSNWNFFIHSCYALFRKIAEPAYKSLDHNIRLMGHWADDKDSSGVDRQYIAQFLFSLLCVCVCWDWSAVKLLYHKWVTASCRAYDNITFYTNEQTNTTPTLFQHTNESATIITIISIHMRLLSCNLYLLKWSLSLISFPYINTFHFTIHSSSRLCFWCVWCVCIYKWCHSPT